MPHLADEPAFITNELRIENRDELDTRLGKVISVIEREKIIKMLEKAGVSCGPINNISEVFNDTHVKARKMRVDQFRSDKSPISSTAFPVKMSQTPAKYYIAPPLLGEHNDEVLKEWIGLPEKKLNDLRACKVI